MASQVHAKLGAAALRRLKKKRQKKKQEAAPVNNKAHPETKVPEGIEIEYVPAPLPVQEEDPAFAKVIARFTVQEEDPADMEAEYGQGVDCDEQQDSFSEGEDAEPKLSRKKLKKATRTTVAQLKQFAARPEVVEWEDVTAKDPKTLVQLKSVRHSVPVPGHWSRKRKYLAGKRGYVKPPFDLPQFIKDTGVMELRAASQAEDTTKRQKVKAREKMHPKLGKITVDYEKLHDAFFKYQTKPVLTGHADMYYEGKEFEGRSRDSRPGFLSEDLRNALGMGHLAPPPWLHNIQKYGAPPSYPHMRIAGFNAPIPEGAQWGFHPGGWGKPPVDTFVSPASSLGRPDASRMRLMLRPVQRDIWGELEPDAEGDSYFLEQEPTEEMTGQVQEMTLDEEQAANFAYQQLERESAAQYQATSFDTFGAETIDTPSSRRR